MPLLNTQAKGLNGIIRGGHYEHTGSGDELSCRQSRYGNIFDVLGKQVSIIENSYNNTNLFASCWTMVSCILHGFERKWIRHLQSCIGWENSKINRSQWWRFHECSNNYQSIDRKRYGKWVRKYGLHNAIYGLGDPISTCLIPERGCA